MANDVFDFDFNELEDEHELETRRITKSRRTQTIEQTGKFWKLFQLLGVLAILGSFATGFIAQNPTATGICVIVGFLGTCAWIFGRLGGWWFHG